MFDGTNLSSRLYSFTDGKSHVKPEQKLGFAVAAADVNGDGKAEIICGAHRGQTGPLRTDPTTGYVRVFNGADGSLLYQLNGEAFDAPVETADGHAGIGIFVNVSCGNIANIAPSRVITAMNSPLGDISGIALDSTGNISVTNGPPLAPVVTVFDANASGAAIPRSVIAGDQTRLSITTDNSDFVVGVALDASGNIYVGHNSHGFLPNASGERRELFARGRRQCAAENGARGAAHWSTGSRRSGV